MYDLVNVFANFECFMGQPYSGISLVNSDFVVESTSDFFSFSSNCSFWLLQEKMAM